MNRQVCIAAAMLVGLFGGSCSSSSSKSDDGIIGPIADLDSWQLSLGQCPLGGERRATLKVMNRGDRALHFVHNGPNGDVPTAPVVVASIAGEFNVPWPPQGLEANSLDAGGEVTFEVVFRPIGDTGERHVEVQIYTDDAEHPIISVPMSAEVIGCSYEADPILTFGTLEPGTPQIVPLTFRSRTILGRCCDLGNFAFGAGNGEPPIFTPVEPLPIGIVFGEGAEITFELRANVPDVGDYASSFEFDVTGETVIHRSIRLVARGDRCMLKLPPSVDFGEVPLGCAADDVAVTVKRRCDNSLHIDSYWLKRNTGEFTLGKPLVARTSQAASWQVKVGYRPGGAVPTVDTLTILTEEGSSFVVPLSGVGVPVTHEEQFVLPTAIDVLFVVASGAAMVPFDEHVSQVYRAIKDALEARRLDWKIGRVWGAKPDGSGDTDGWINQIETPRSLQGTPSIVAGGDALLEAARRAMIDPALNGHNQGFRREEAALAIVIVGNGRDESNLPASDYASFFLQRVEPTRRNDVQFAGAVPTQKMGANIPGTSSSGAPPCNHAAEADAALVTSVASKMLGTVEEFCTDAARVVSAVAGPRRTYVLQRRPSPDAVTAIRVEVDGNSIPAKAANGATNWSYDAVDNAIVLEPAVRLYMGTEVKVTFDQSCH